MTGRAEVADQARAVAAAWSPPGAPESWWLTAETFAAIAEDDVLLDLAVGVPADRLPPLLLSAAITLSSPSSVRNRWPATTRGPAGHSLRATTGSVPRCTRSRSPRATRCAGCAGGTATR